MNIQKINSQKEFQDICQKKFDGFRAENSTGYYIAGFPSENLYKGINCTHVIEGYAERDSFFSAEYYILTEQGEFKTNEHAAILPINSKERFYGIIGNDKCISLNFTMHSIHMKQATPAGVYELRLNTRPNLSIYPTHVYFHSNEDILKYAEGIGFEKEEAESKFDTIKFRFAHDLANYLGSRLPYGWENLPRLTCNLSTGKPTDEFVMLANMIYRKGLPYVAELARNGEPLEITEEDRKFYETPTETIEPSIAPIEEQAPDEDQDVVELVEGDYPEKENTGISNLEEAIASLRNLKSMGVELTDSQKELVTTYDRLTGNLNSQKFMWYYEKLKSDEFQQYKDTTDKERGERLQTVRENIAQEEAKKQEWYASPENPSNIRNGQIQTMSNQLDALNNVNRFMPLADAQEESRRELETFFAMKELADTEDHTLDSSMSEDIRTWYQDEYGMQETGGKAK